MNYVAENNRNSSLTQGQEPELLTDRLNMIIKTKDCGARGINKLLQERVINEGEAAALWIHYLQNIDGAHNDMFISYAEKAIQAAKDAGFDVAELEIKLSEIRTNFAKEDINQKVINVIEKILKDIDTRYKNNSHQFSNIKFFQDKSAPFEETIDQIAKLLRNIKPTETPEINNVCKSTLSAVISILTAKISPEKAIDEVICLLNTRYPHSPMEGFNIRGVRELWTAFLRKNGFSKKPDGNTGVTTPLN